jgi:hypothetical protein
MDTTLINIDSKDRMLVPKNICSQLRQLDNNPILTRENSDIIKITCSNHGYKKGDNIIIKDCKGPSLVGYDVIYLLNRLNYAIIDMGVNVLPKHQNDDIYVSITIKDDQVISNYIQNIPIGMILGIKKIYSYINPISLTSYSEFLKTRNPDNLFYIKLNYQYIGSDVSISQIFNIEHLHISGVPLGYFNADYPINDVNYQNKLTIHNIIDSNTFEVKILKNALLTGYFGGINITIGLINTSIDGYPDPNNYVIYLKNSYSNVTSIELESIEIPYTDTLLSVNNNNTLDWMLMNDGNVTYSITVSAGFYSGLTLAETIESEMNKVKRIGYQPYNKVYNMFTVDFDQTNHVYTFTSYESSNLPKCLSIRPIVINSENYYLLNVNHPNNTVQVNDTITISGASSVDFIDSKYINGSFTVYSCNVENQSYDIILGKITQFSLLTESSINNGGENIVIKTYTLCSLLLNTYNTIGSLLGWTNTGNKYAVTDYKAINKSSDNYIYYNNVNSVGNTIYSNGFVNLSGKYNYIFMYLNDIEYIENTGVMPAAFAKILLDGNPGDILFNTHVSISSVNSKSMPISSLESLYVRFMYPDGSLVNFRNLDHSFTLKVRKK